MTLRPYMAFAGDDPMEGSVLVFDRTAREAKKTAYPVVESWTDCQWIDLRVRMLRPRPDIMRQATSDEPHVIDDPAGCPRCLNWGSKPTRNGCEGCEGEL